MINVEELIDRVLKNKEAIFRYIVVVQAMTGVFLLFMAYFMGHVHFHLIRTGNRTIGKIIDYKETHIASGPSRQSTITFLPIVEFTAKGGSVRFTDWLGSSSAAGRGDRVTVLYDPEDPSVAMIDRPVMNWIPWAPIGAAGFFLCLAALRRCLSNQFA
jgi:hypothetical protein